MSDGGKLKREVGVVGATMMGIGSMVGTGVFVSIGIAAGVAGPAVLLAIALAAIVATCNALSSAQLAASMPVSGGTYEYGYAYLTPWLGFTAGWMFLCAKTASAATAALGLRRLSSANGRARVAGRAGRRCRHCALTAIVMMGIRRSNRANIAIVSITLFALGFFVLAGLPQLWSKGEEAWHPFFLSSDGGSPWPGLLEATALMFVAFTGYARIATLGEEMRDPERTIPRAIIATLVVSALLYISVGAVAIAAIGPQSLGGGGADRRSASRCRGQDFRSAHHPHDRQLSAPSRRCSGSPSISFLGCHASCWRWGAAPTCRGCSPMSMRLGSPSLAVIAVGMAIAALALIGNVEVTWSFSAFTVLIYYAITNLAALRLPKEKRLYSPLFAWAGLAACLALAFFVERQIWMVGLALIGAGLIWHAVAQRRARLE